MGSIKVGVKIGSVFSDTVVVDEINIQDPEITLEGTLDGNNLGVFASALPTPEASTWLMMLAGFGGMALLARRKMLLSAN